MVGEDAVGDAVLHHVAWHVALFAIDEAANIKGAEPFNNKGL